MLLALWTILNTVTATPFGEVFGDLRLGDKYLKEVKLELKCGTETVPGKTDEAGSFRLAAKTDGKCQLTVMYEDQKPTIDIVMFAQPARYRLLLELKDGKYVVKRV